jgi:hypothetical protein
VLANHTYAHRVEEVLAFVDTLKHHTKGSSPWTVHRVLCK